MTTEKTDDGVRAPDVIAKSEGERTPQASGVPRLMSESALAFQPQTQFVPEPAYALVVPDIATRSLNQSYSYRIPADIDTTSLVGSTVLVDFGRRQIVGYVIGLSSSLPKGVEASRIKPIRRVLASSAFDELAAQLANWIAQEYAAPLSEALRLFLAPGQSIKVKRTDAKDSWELICDRVGELDRRYVSITDFGRTYQTKKSASRQRAILAALAEGSMRMSELSATLGSVNSAVSALEKKGAVTIELRREFRGVAQTTLSTAHARRPQKLTKGQTEALCAIEAAVRSARGDVVLVDGITGSGKTEVYLSAIEQVLERGQSAIVLVPEISLTPQTLGRFHARFGDQVAVLHSKLSAGERFDQWDMLRCGHARVVVGARSALFAPLSNLGLIVIDEEHEQSYKQDSQPRYHARDVAAKLAQLRGCALVLGSATPSLESLYRSEQGMWRGASWQRVEMSERPGQAALPRIRVVDMCQQFRSGAREVFSAELKHALLEVRNERKKAVLLLNRRGFASFLMCRDCGAVPSCPHCSTSLTYHERGHLLMCHSCGRSWPQVAWPHPQSRCPSCGSIYLAQCGLGTQRVEDELHVLLGSDIDIIRMDADSTRGKSAHQRLLERFDASECAVLVGTQMIAKGLDFPEVTLVGVINADTMLKLPDFRAAERTYDLLEQVAGRAGRAELAGQVIIQSYWAGADAIQAVLSHHRERFVAGELALRKEACYPPYARLVNIVAWGLSEGDVRSYLDEIAARIRASLEQVTSDETWELVGPAACLKSRIKDKHRRHLLIKVPLGAQPGPFLLGILEEIGARKGISVAVDVDPYDLM